MHSSNSSDYLGSNDTVAINTHVFIVFLHEKIHETSQLNTSRKINMEHENHLFKNLKSEKHLPNPAVNYFQGFRKSQGHPNHQLIVIQGFVWTPRFWHMDVKGRGFKAKGRYLESSKYNDEKHR